MLHHVDSFHGFKPGTTARNFHTAKLTVPEPHVYGKVARRLQYHMTVEVVAG